MMAAERITSPERCADCDAPWETDGRCPRCGVDRAAIDALRAAACREFAAARQAAGEGRYAAARQSLRAARDLGLRHAAVERLDALCAAVTGEDAPAASLPEAWRDAWSDNTTLFAVYAKAREAAAREAWDEALAQTEACRERAPWLLPAQKLRLLSLAGAGRWTEAERVRQELLTEAPAEPDLIRWRFTAPAPRRAREIVYRRVGLAAAAVAAAGLALAAALAPWRVPGTPAVTVGASSAPLASNHPQERVPGGAGKSDVTLPSGTPLIGGGGGEGLASPLLREREANRRAADRAQARRWFNAAVRAYRAGNDPEAERLAAGTAALGAGTYLEDEALLLRAQAAERRGDARAGERYARLADRVPGSAYAPLALLKAAGIAARQGRRAAAAEFVRRLRREYPGARETARARRLWDAENGANP